jgi:cytochrome c oxidase subunit 1
MESASVSVSTTRTRVPTAWRQLLGYNILWATALAVGGYALGHWIGSKIGAHLASSSLTDQDDVAIFMGMLFAIIGWIGGLGFLSYPLGRIIGRPSTLREREERGAWRYFSLCTDHKVVAVQYLVAVLFFFFVAGLNAMFIRGELTSDNATFIQAGNYLTLVGLHGTMMLMMMSAAILGPLGNYLVPLMIGSRRMAFPRVEALTFWLTPLADQARAGIDAYIV